MELNAVKEPGLLDAEEDQILSSEDAAVKNISFS